MWLLWRERWIVSMSRRIATLATVYARFLFFMLDRNSKVLTSEAKLYMRNVPACVSASTLLESSDKQKEHITYETSGYLIVHTMKQTLDMRYINAEMLSKLLSQLFAEEWKVKTVCKR
jgi:hypothetical protein